MNRQSDWQADSEPPTAEEMLAYSRGELPSEEAARLWKRLQQHPDLARAYTAPFPESGAEPGDAHYVSDVEISRRWASFSGNAGGLVLWFPRVLSAVAAALIVVLGGLLWQSQMRVRQLQTELAEPRVFREIVLSEDAAVRGRPRTLTVSGKDLKLVLLADGDHFDEYKAELRAAGDTRPHWQGRVERSEDDQFEITLLRIEPGQYQLALHGITGEQTQPLGTYSFNVAP